MAGAQQKVGLGRDLGIVHRPEGSLLDANADPRHHSLHPAGHGAPVQVRLVELDLVCEPNVRRIGSQIVQVDEQAGPLAIEEVGALVGVGGMKIAT